MRTRNRGIPLKGDIHKGTRLLCVCPEEDRQINITLTWIYRVVEFTPSQYGAIVIMTDTGKRRWVNKSVFHVLSPTKEDYVNIFKI